MKDFKVLVRVIERISLMFIKMGRNLGGVGLEERLGVSFGFDMFEKIITIFNKDR